MLRFALERKNNAIFARHKNKKGTGDKKQNSYRK
jgi:hypothetical protein